MARHQHSPKRKPRDPHTILVRIPLAQHRLLKQKADAERRSVNAEVLTALDAWLKPKAAPDAGATEGAAA